MNEPAKHSTLTEKEIFFAALELSSSSELAAFLEGACGGNQALRRRVEQLLRNQAEPDSFMAGPAATAPGEAGQEAIRSEQPGDRIGRYKLLKKIGEGGCGVVYLAEQEEPVRRQVALKVIKLGMDTKSVIARFEAERQALALMDHPHIAKVHDAGATATGRPFFVMELVNGIRITDYCDQKQLSTPQRLALFIQVCQAIQHAHQKGIIHRDIKPSNTLVADQDGTAIPKVIDFGIAKATTDQRLTDKTIHTASDQFIGTPAYISPEQAKLSGMDVDTRADIYSLGVLLYELLTGKTPFDSRRLVEVGLDEVRRIIQEEDPPRPSTRLSTLEAAEQTTVARHRCAELPRLVYLLRGDLDWIVMKCLEKDRTRRYETANGLAMDVQRHLNHEPVVARPRSKLYRFTKFVHRNKLAFGAAVALTVALLMGLTVSIWLLAREKVARQRAVEAEHSAAAEARKSRQVADLLQAMLKGVGPEVAKGRSAAMMLELLDKTDRRITHDLTNQPAVEAELRATMGDVYHQLGQYPRARQMFSRALALQESSEHDEKRMALLLSQLGEALREGGDLHESEKFHRQALELTRKSFGEVSLQTAVALDNMGLILWEQSDLAAAEDFARQSVRTMEKLPAASRVGLHYATALGDLANTLQLRGKLVEAKDLLQRAIEEGKHMVGESLDVGAFYNNLGNVELDLGNLDAAEKSWLNALELLKGVPPNAPHLLLVRSHLATVARRRGSLSVDAEALFRRALQTNPADLRTADALACSLAKPALTALPSSPAGPWRFTTVEPATNWTALDFSTADWSNAPGPFAGPVYSPRSERAIPRHTNVWVRQEFDLAQVPAGKLVLVLNRCQNARIFLNGVPLAPVVDWNDTETLRLCSTAGQAALRSGRNALAMHCQDIDGGTSLGVRLYVAGDMRAARQQLRQAYDELIGQEPARAELYSGRGHVLAQHGNWPEASQDLAQAISLKPFADVHWYRRAVLLVEMGDLPAYRSLRQNAQEKFAEPDGPEVAQRMARLCLLLPVAEEDELEKAARMADLAAACDYADKGLAWRQLTKALAEYRRGHDTNVTDWASRALATGSRQDLPGWTHERERNRAASSWALQSMAEHRLGRMVEATAAFSKASLILETECPLLDSGDLGREWQDLLLAHVLWREAKGLIQNTDASRATR